MSDYYVKNKELTTVNGFSVGDTVKVLPPLPGGSDPVVEGIIEAFYRGNFGKGRLYAALKDKIWVDRYHPLTTIRKLKSS